MKLKFFNYSSEKPRIINCKTRILPKLLFFLLVLITLILYVKSDALNLSEESSKNKSLHLKNQFELTNNKVKKYSVMNLNVNNKEESSQHIRPKKRHFIFVRKDALLNKNNQSSINNNDSNYSKNKEISNLKNKTLENDNSNVEVNKMVNRSLGMQYLMNKLKNKQNSSNHSSNSLNNNNHYMNLLEKSKHRLNNNQNDKSSSTTTSSSSFSSSKTIIKQEEKEITEQLKLAVTSKETFSNNPSIKPDKMLKDNSNNKNENVSLINDLTNPNNLLKGWFTISSEEFNNKQRFPLLMTKKGSKFNYNSIKLDGFNTRINLLNNLDSANDDKLISNPLINKLFYFQSRGDLIYYSSAENDINILDNIVVKEVFASENFILMKKYKNIKFGDLKTLIEDLRSKTLSIKDTSSWYCLSIIDTENKQWVICGNDISNYLTWLCSLQKFTNQNKKDKICSNKNILILESLINGINSVEVNDDDHNTDVENTIEDSINNNIRVENKEETIIIIPEYDRSCSQNWDYNSLGDDWECQCKEGKRQSPININPEKIKLSPIKPIFIYSKTSNIIDNSNTTLDEINSKGKLKIRYHQHRLKILYSNFGSLIDLNGSVFSAEEITFHTPSEHTINGVRYDLEMQIIHYGTSKGDIAKQAVLSVLFKSKPGVYNKFFDKIDFFNLPNKKISSKEINFPLNINDIMSEAESVKDDNFRSNLPRFSFYSYDGSLTFPPCTERTTVYVVSEPVPLSNTIIKLFQEALLEPEYLSTNNELVFDQGRVSNVRKTQSLNGREVFYYDYKVYEEASFETKPDSNSNNNSNKNEENGHYEKIYRDVTSYFYVNGKETTDLPGAFVVSDEEALKLPEN